MARLILLSVIFVAAGCTSAPVAQDPKPAFNSSRGPAAATGNLLDILMRQQFCVDGKFYFQAHTRGSGAIRHQGCVTLAMDIMTSPQPIDVEHGDTKPSGNFADVILEKALNRADMTYREMEPTEVRNYWVKPGHCGGQPLFVVESIIAQARPPVDGPVQNACQFETPVQMSGKLPLAGVYSRVRGEPAQSLINKLK